ncbi:hypothetical protein AWC38_SpisGene11608 [Stylophora pistillata]|uniref:Uncharacterized protein n=1 Tax=Stylophora pistillata TaxID=50429 RepID=A0A2B4S5N1_STYPI|nr:hypothetical protein AWC38_SpisGene11608 [Stylophora pistillata]
MRKFRKGDNVLLDLGDDGFLSAKLADFGSAQSAAMERTLQRQNSCNPVEDLPSQAMDTTKQLLRLLFGQDGSIPTAAAVLKHSEAFPEAELLKRLRKES